MISHENIIHQLQKWATEEPSVRAVVLTSSRAITHAHTDAFSDYEVILALSNIEPF